MTAAPLSGLRVLDLADDLGELCGRVLADLGADVARIEPPGGAASRRLPPFAPDGRTSLYFAVRNAGKRSVVLDLASDAGLERLHEWLAGSDLLIESFSPGHLASLDLDPAALLERHPHLVVTSISPFGQTGPYRDYLGSDMIGFAMSGMMHRSGIPEKPPCVAPGHLAWDTTAVTAAFASLMAYWQRLRSGRGQHVDVSVYESSANLSDWGLPHYSRSPNPGMRAGFGIYTVYPCADGFVRMIILVKHHWRALREWMGDPPELRDPAYDVFLARLVRKDEIEPVIAHFFRDRKKVDVACEAQRRGIPATPMLEPSEVISNEHCRARGTFARLAVAPGTEADVPSGFFTLSGERAGPRRGPPSLGEHGAAPFPERVAPPAAPPADPEGRPLAGLRVLDFGVGAVGVEVGRFFAEYGADVVKIESARAPDFIRTIMNTWMNPSFASSSRSKRSFGVDLKSDGGRTLVHRLVAAADVVIENNGAGVMERLGLDYATLRAINPRLLMFSSQMVGAWGPWKHWIGYGPSTHPVSGMQYLWNYPEDEDRPAGSTNVHPDHFVGRVGMLGLLAGLVRRERTGEGMHVDVAQFEAQIQLLGDLLARESLAPGSVKPQGNASERGAPWGAYPCAGEDEWCVINVASDAQWLALVDRLGAPAWAAVPAYRRAPGRIAARDAIDRELAAWTAQRSSREVMEELQAAGVPAAMVQHAGHHREDPHLTARGYHRPVEQPDLGRVVLEGPGFRGSALPEPVVAPAPRLGEHTREIAARDLGLSEAEIDDLVAKGVLEDPPPPMG